MNKTIIAAAALAAAILAGAAWFAPPAATLPAGAASVTTAPARARTAPPPSEAGAVREASLAEQVDALVATGKPQKAFDAYWLLADCATFMRDGDRLIFDQAEARQPQSDGTLPGFRAMTEAEKRHDAVFCASMTERMRQSRIDYLDLAARGGVAGAVMEQVAQGPFGDRSALTTRPDDALVREWKARVQTQLSHAAEQDANFMVLGYLSTIHMIGNDVVDKDPALAFRYGVAYGMIDADVNGAGGMVSKLYGPDGSMVRESAAALTAQERSAQVLEARRIADLARRHRQQNAAGTP